MADVDAKKQKMEYLAITVLVIVALFIGMGRFKKKDKKKDIFSKDEFTERWKEVKILEKTLPAKEKKILYSVEAERVPFKSPFEDIKKAEKELDGEEEIVLPSLSFEGMVWNSVRPQAIINNTVYDINDKILVDGDAGADFIKIKSITKEGILVEYKRRGFLVRPK